MGWGTGRPDIRCSAWALLGTIAEDTASVRERRDGHTVLFEVITGVPDGGRFASHGHTVRLRVSPPAAG